VAQDDPRVIEALEEYIVLLETGRRPARETFLAAHPEIAGALAKCLDGLEFVCAAAPELSHCGTASASAAAESVLPPVPLGDFRIVREVGRGGMGVVYEAIQLSLGRRVALKVLPFAAALDARQLQRFKNEAQAAAHLHHTNIVPVYSVGCERGLHYYAMQFIEGQTLAELIQQLRPRARSEDRRSKIEDRGSRAAEQGPTVAERGSGAQTLPRDPRSSILDPRSSDVFRTVALLGIQAAQGLEHAHQMGIVHRDIKPGNLMLEGALSPGAAVLRLWITDFGLAQFQSDTRLTLTGDLLGTLRYMSPEQALGKRVLVDHRADIYSLGVTLYELLTLGPAFDGRDRQEVLQQIAFHEPRPPRRVNRAIPVELETIVLKAMAKEPEGRYVTAQALADDLRRFLDDKPILARRPTLRERGRKWVRRHKPVVVAAAVVLVMALVALAVSSVLILAAYRAETGQREEAERQRDWARAHLYHSLVGEARALRLARVTGYRPQAWQKLQEAQRLDTPERDLDELRQEAVACLGDCVGLEPITLKDFPAAVASIALHPRATQVAVGLRDGTVCVPSLPSGAEAARLHGHRSVVSAVVFSADGSRMVSADLSGAIRIWQPDPNSAWSCTRTIATAPDVVAVTITPDGTRLAACSRHAAAVALWDLADGTRAGEFKAPQGAKLSCMAMSAGGNLLAAGYRKDDEDRDGILVWEVASRRLQQEVQPELDNLAAVAFSPDGRLLACTCQGGFAVFDTVAFRRLTFVRTDNLGAVAFNSDSRVLAFTAQSGGIRLWNVVVNREVAVLRRPGANEQAVAFDADGRALASADAGSVTVWALATPEKLGLAGHAGGVPGLAFSPNGRLLASAGKDRTVKIWDAAGGQVLRILSGFPDHAQAVTFSPDGRLLAAATWSGSKGVRVWEVASWEEQAALPSPGSTWSVAFSPNGRYLAVGGSDGVVLWEVAAMRQVGRLPARNVRTLCFSGDSSLLAWAGEDRTLEVWDVQGSARHPFPVKRIGGAIQSLAFYPDGTHLTFHNSNAEVEVWDARTGQRAFSLGTGRSHIALSPDGRWCAAHHTLWDTRSRKRLFTLPSERERTVGLWWSAFSPDGDRFAIGLADGGIVIWDLRSVRTQLAGIGLDWESAAESK
jgi:WD40 repeat protein/serine/threonine protein kinase